MGRQLSVLLALTICAASGVSAQKVGRIFIKAVSADVGGQQFPDAELEKSVKDLKNHAGDFIIADDEAGADYLLVVIKREQEKSGKNGSQDYRRITAALSVRDGETWKPGAQLVNTGWLNGGTWSVAARGLMGATKKWVKEHPGKVENH
jgi:hypothetical protein